MFWNPKIPCLESIWEFYFVLKMSLNHFIFSKTVSFSPFFGSIWGCRVELLLFLMKTVATSHGPKIWIIHSIIPWCFAIHHVFFWCVPTWLKKLKIFLRWLNKSLLPAVTSMIIPASVHLTAQAPVFRHHEDWRDRSL